MRPKTRLSLVLCAGLLMLALAPAAAFASQSLQGGYNNNAGNLAVQVGSGNQGPPTAGPTATKSGSLPFTGQDLTYILATAGGLLVMGFGLRTLTRRGRSGA